VFIAQMKSRITALDDQEDQRTIITSGANVDIAFPNSTLFSAAELTKLQDDRLTKFKALFTAPIMPNGGIKDAGFGLIPEELVARIAAKADLTKSFRIEAVATFTVVGDMSGQRIESQAFSYPVTIGNGLSVFVAGPCPLPSTFGSVHPGYSCNSMQDGQVDCCIATSGGVSTLTCPAPLATN
jgi:hypothetical protein